LPSGVYITLGSGLALKPLLTLLPGIGVGEELVRLLLELDGLGQVACFRIGSGERANVVGDLPEEAINEGIGSLPN